MSEITGAELAIIIFHHFDKHAAARRILEWTSFVSWETSIASKTFSGGCGDAVTVGCWQITWVDFPQMVDERVLA